MVYGFRRAANQGTVNELQQCRCGLGAHINHEDGSCGKHCAAADLPTIAMNVRGSRKYRTATANEYDSSTSPVVGALTVLAPWLLRMLRLAGTYRTAFKPKVRQSLPTSMLFSYCFSPLHCEDVAIPTLLPIHVEPLSGTHAIIVRLK